MTQDDLDIISQVQDGSPGQQAGLEAFFDFIVAIGNTRLVSSHTIFAHTHTHTHNFI